MKAVVIEAFGGPEVLKSVEIPTPTPGPGEVLLKVKACALNHMDLWVRGGIPAYNIKLPHILGCDIAGEIAQLGPGVKSVRVGERAAVSPGRSCRQCQACRSGDINLCRDYGIIGERAGPGGYAEYLAVPEDYLLPMPQTLSFEEAAAFPLTFLTAWHMLISKGGCGPGQIVMVMGSSSGVGVAAIQIAKLAGAKVIAVSTSEEKNKKAKSLGADATICSTTQNIYKEMRRMTDGAMADIVFEHVGPAVFETAVKSLKSGGKLITCGSTSGPVVSLDMRYIFSRELQIMGALMGTHAEMLQVAKLVAAGKLKPIVDKTFPLKDARQAHEYLADKKQFGKVVLQP